MAPRRFGANEELVHWRRHAMLLGTVRSDADYFDHWHEVLRPGLDFSPWSPAEDHAVRDIVLEHGLGALFRDRSEIAALLPERTGKMCRERWSCHIIDSDCFHKGDWTVENVSLPGETARYRIRHRGSGSVAITLLKIGIADSRVSDHVKALGRLELSLNLQEKEYGHDDMCVASTLTTLGDVYGELGAHAKKRDLLERALAIQEKALRERDPLALAHCRRTLWNLINVYGDLGDRDAAKFDFRDVLVRALAIFERAYDTGDTAKCRKALADLDGQLSAIVPVPSEKL